MSALDDLLRNLATVVGKREGESMTLVVELDDGTPVDVSTIRETLTAHAATNRVVLHLTRGDAELAVGFRGERGACYWRRDDDLVSCGGDNADVEIYGANEIPFPPGSEIDKTTVINAADEFATTGARPTCVAWTSYRKAMQASPEESTITPEQLRALLGEPDTDQQDRSSAQVRKTAQHPLSTMDGRGVGV